MRMEIGSFPASSRRTATLAGGVPWDRRGQHPNQLDRRSLPEKSDQGHPEDLYWFCLLGSLDHLQRGVTTAYDFNYSRTDWQGDGNEFDEAQFRAELKSNIRFVHGYEPGWAAPGYGISQARKRLKAFLDWTATQPRLIDVPERDDQRRHGLQQYLPASGDGKGAHG